MEMLDIFELDGRVWGWCGGDGLVFEVVGLRSCDLKVENRSPDFEDSSPDVRVASEISIGFRRIFNKI
jgi:hypothetical protein